MSNREELIKMAEETANMLRMSGDMTLQVVADLDQVITGHIADLIDRYREDGERAPSPADFIMGLIVFNIAICEEVGFRMRGQPDAGSEFKKILQTVVETGGKRLLASLIRDARVNLETKEKRDEIPNDC